LPIVTIKLTDEEFNQLKSKAASKGYETISDYLKSIALSEPKLLPQAEVAQKVQPEEVMPKESLQSILRAVQDMINPFTAKIDELARSIGELRERLDRLEEALKLGLPVKDAVPPEIYDLMELYKAPLMHRSGVEYVPAPLKRAEK